MGKVVDITTSLDGYVAGPDPIELRRTRVIDSPAATHLTFEIVD